MNTNLYAENPNAARKVACKEVFEDIQRYTRFYEETKGFNNYYEKEKKDILLQARDKWQQIVGGINANAIYFGCNTYPSLLKFAHVLRNLIDNVENNKYSVIMVWQEKYPKLIELHQKIENLDEYDELVFMDYYNELRYVINKEFILTTSL